MVSPSGRYCFKVHSLKNKMRPRLQSSYVLSTGSLCNTQMAQLYAIMCLSLNYCIETTLVVSYFLPIGPNLPCSDSVVIKPNSTGDFPLYITNHTYNYSTQCLSFHLGYMLKRAEHLLSPSLSSIIRRIWHIAGIHQYLFTHW